MKVCDPALEADFAEIAAPGAYLARISHPGAGDWFWCWKTMFFEEVSLFP
jgi:hypothetical protein